MLAQMKRKTEPLPTVIPKTQKASNPAKQSTKNTSKPVVTPITTSYDPLVARLKAARLAEREALLAKKVASSSKSSSTSSTSRLKPSKTIRSKPSISREDKLRQEILLDHQLERKIKKPSYKELMLQAAKIDTSKMAISIKTKTHSKQTPKLDLSSKTKAKTIPTTPRQGSRTEEQPKIRQESVAKQKQNIDISRPARRPARYQDYEEDDELSDFLDSEDESLIDYHSEILNLFGNRKRQYYDDDSSDDMEATGADILNEENRSSRILQYEEQRELEIEKQKKMAKLKKFKRN